MERGKRSQLNMIEDYCDIKGNIHKVEIKSREELEKLLNQFNQYIGVGLIDYEKFTVITSEDIIYVTPVIGEKPFTLIWEGDR